MHITALVNKTEVFNAHGRKNLVRTFQRLQFIFLIGIPASNVLLPVYKTFAGKCF